MPFENAFAITPILRDLPPQNEFVVRWNGHRFSRFDADPTAIEGREKPKEKKPKSAGFIPGSYREMFAQMPPLRNGSDPAHSEVLAYIAAELNAQGKDAESADKVFHIIRQPHRKIIRYSQVTKRWVGCEYQAPEKGGSK